MPRADEGLAFLLQFENIAWYEDGAVRILDRRCYPHPVSFVTCKSTEEVARAIQEMVTQSAGPYLAAGMGMALAAKESERLGGAARKEYLIKAADLLSTARPTTEKRMRIITNGCLDAAVAAMEAGEDVTKAVFDRTVAVTETRYRKIEKTAKYLVDQFPAHGTIMTQCFAETIVGFMLKEAAARGLDIKVICPETRPYFQGARLTASVALDQGFDVTVITDNMPG